MKLATQQSELVEKLLSQQDGKCFICQNPIDPESDDIEVDHIIPRAKGGKDEENNYAATHQWCNRSKSDSDLRVARCLAKYEEIKDKCSTDDPKRPHLGDFLAQFGGGKFSPHVVRADKLLSVSFHEAGEPPTKHAVYRDKLSGFDYAF